MDSAIRIPHSAIGRPLEPDTVNTVEGRNSHPTAQASSGCVTVPSFERWNGFLILDCGGLTPLLRALDASELEKRCQATAVQMGEHFMSAAIKPAEDEAITDNNEKPLPNSRRIYVAGKQPGVRVPFREIDQSPTRNFDNSLEENPAVRVYDTSGPWGDPDFHNAGPAQTVEQGLPPLRAKWIRDRGDVEEIDGRKVQPIDDGYLSETHAAHASKKRSTSNAQLPTFNVGSWRLVVAGSGVASTKCHSCIGTMNP